MEDVESICLSSRAATKKTLQKIYIISIFCVLFTGKHEVFLPQHSDLAIVLTVADLLSKIPAYQKASQSKADPHFLKILEKSSDLLYFKGNLIWQMDYLIP